MRKILSYFDLKSKTGKVSKTKKECFVLFFCFLLGLAISIAVVGTSANSQDVSLFKILSDSIEKTLLLNVTSLFFNSILVNSLWLIISYFLGTSAFGYPFIFCMPLIIGVQKGSFISAILINKGISFFTKAFIFFVLQNSFIILVLIISFLYSLRMSAQTFYMVRGVSRLDIEYIDFKKYNRIFILIFVLLIFLSLSDAFLVNFL